jgi:hypothetical protein
VGSSPENAGTVQHRLMGRVRQARQIRRNGSEPVVEPLKALEPARIAWIWAGQQPQRQASPTVCGDTAQFPKTDRHRLCGRHSGRRQEDMVTPIYCRSGWLGGIVKHTAVVQRDQTRAQTR